MKLRDTVELLQELGVPVNVMRGDLHLPKNFFNDPEAARRFAKTLCEKNSFAADIEVGDSEPFKPKRFVNLMGASVNHDVALRVAQIMYQKLKQVGGAVSNFDFVCVPKAGSPYIGYELGKLVDKPLVLFKEVKKVRYSGAPGQFDQRFDGSLPDKGKRALLVDDSSTGGSMLIAAASVLRELGYTVDTALVVFEPIGKQGREALKRNGIEMVAVIQIDVRK